MDKQLTVGSLFSGIGGLDLGLERAGMRVIWQSEIEPFACRVLKKHWPEVPNYGDIKKIEWEKVERPNVLCGGYPCQPFSTAGKRKGEEDPRHLWPWVREAISRLRPDYAILENVRGHLTMGGLSVIGDLAAVGYNAEWRIVSAASVGANHRRDRIIIVAYPDNAGDRTPRSDINGDGSATEQERQNVAQFGTSGRGSGMADAAGARREAFNVQTEADGTENAFYLSLRERRLYAWWETEPDVGRVANGIPNRVDRLRGLGNAVVPQVAEVIGRLVIEHANNG